MNTETVKENFLALVAPDLPNEWDVDEAVEQLAEVDEEKCRTVLNQVPVIWPVSHSLCFDYLKTAVTALDCLALENLPEWVNRTLDQYEKQGLRAARQYMADVEQNFLCALRGDTKATFKQVHGRLLPYLRGLSGRPLELTVHDIVHTDTSTIFIPPEVHSFDSEADNFFMYKLIVTYQWAFIACSSYTVSDAQGSWKDDASTSDSLWLDDFLASFPDRPLAAELYHLLETVRVSAFLEKELPGLMRRKTALLEGVRTGFSGSSTEVSALDVLRNEIVSQVPGIPGSPGAAEALRLVREHRVNGDSPMDSVDLVQKMYMLITDSGEKYTPGTPPLYQGHMLLDAVLQARNKRLRENRLQFVDALAVRLLKQQQKNREDTGPESPTDKPAAPVSDGISVIMDTKGQAAEEDADSTLVIVINNEQVTLDEELQALVEDIISDLGYLPRHYIASAAGKAGKGYAPFAASEPESGPALFTPIVYDEWDYRRNDFRKKWCSVIEKEIPLVTNSFYPATLEKYYGQISRLRYQFEMMRSTERFVRRQRDGDDIDFDALVESVGDSRAGLAPSERLFVRLKRDERDIAVLFLIDMSNSTQGWINEAIRESLVLLCEALEMVGDRYSIYGFSGMRRLRSDFFHIKHFDEPYDQAVKQRICSIAPREYTRMGSALRHAASLLAETDARVRLLITLSDGKPEDYDDYKGEYAIEDTRHALFEAKAAGIHPFCITIDRYAQDYIPHMYGSVNYIQIDDVKKLPHRMPEIYRVLTS